MPDAAYQDGAESRLGRATTLAMAVGAGAAVANIYYNQPMLGAITRSFGEGPVLAGLIPTATQIGYALGLLLLVPLGDRMDRRRLIALQSGGLLLALAAAALSPTATTLVAASVAIGIGSTVAQQIVPFAAELAAPARRGAVIGIVMSGLLAGILLGRVLSGAVAQAVGWRAMFWLGAGLAAAMGVMLARVLPRSRPSAGGSYPALLASLLGLLRQERALRRAALVQAAMFAGFSAFWSVLALRLQVQFHLGSGVAGLFGVLGAAGALAAPVAGRMADRHGPRAVLGAGIVASLAGWGVLAAWPSLAGIAAGVILLDLGAQASLLANQSVIFALRPEARNRVNTVFMVIMFAGGALGSALGGFAWAQGAWPALAALGIGATLLAGALFLRH